jgi:hypothetical protein
MAASTRARVSGLTLGLPLNTRETVIGDTPISAAASCMVIGLRARFDIFINGNRRAESGCALSRILDIEPMSRAANAGD